MFEKLKSIILDDTVYVAFLLVLVAVGSFGLGRLAQSPLDNKMAAAQLGANLVTATTAKKIEVLDNEGFSTVKSNQSVGLEIKSDHVQSFTASKSGTKYHRLNCSGAKQIKDSNKIFFATENEAQAAGYTRAANCSF